MTTPVSLSDASLSPSEHRPTISSQVGKLRPARPPQNGDRKGHYSKGRDRQNQTPVRAPGPSDLKHPAPSSQSTGRPAVLPLSKTNAYVRFRTQSLGQLRRPRANGTSRSQPSQTQHLERPLPSIIHPRMATVGTNRRATGRQMRASDASLSVVKDRATRVFAGGPPPEGADRPVWFMPADPLPPRAPAASGVFFLTRPRSSRLLALSSLSRREPRNRASFRSSQDCFCYSRMNGPSIRSPKGLRTGKSPPRRAFRELGFPRARFTAPVRFRGGPGT